MVIVALNSPPDTFNICIIVESCHTSCSSPGSVLFFSSALHVPCNFLLGKQTLGGWQERLSWEGFKLGSVGSEYPPLLGL